MLDSNTESLSHSSPDPILQQRFAAAVIMKCVPCSQDGSSWTVVDDSAAGGVDVTGERYMFLGPFCINQGGSGGGFDGAIRFDPSAGGHVSVMGSEMQHLLPTQDITIEMWVRFTAGGSDWAGPISASQDDGSTEHGWNFQTRCVGGCDNGRRLEFPLATEGTPGTLAYLGDTGGHGGTTFSTGGPYTVSFPDDDGRWLHWAANYDGSTMEMFIDGVSVSSDTETASGAIHYPSSGYEANRGGWFTIGAYHDTNEYYPFPGAIDELRVWHAAVAPTLDCGTPSDATDLNYFWQVCSPQKALHSPALCPPSVPARSQSPVSPALPHADAVVQSSSRLPCPPVQRRGIGGRTARRHHARRDHRPGCHHSRLRRPGCIAVRGKWWRRRRPQRILRRRCLRHRHPGWRRRPRHHLPARPRTLRRRRQRLHHLRRRRQLHGDPGLVPGGGALRRKHRRCQPGLRRHLRIRGSGRLALRRPR